MKIIRRNSSSGPAAWFVAKLASLFLPLAQFLNVGACQERFQINERWAKKGHVGRAIALSYSPEGKHVASGGSDGIVVIWNPATGDVVRRLSDKRQSHCSSIAWLDKGESLASAGADSVIHLWDLKTGTITTTLTGHLERVTSLASNSRGDMLVSGGEDGTVRLWDTTKKAETFRRQEQDWIHAVGLTSDGSFIISGDFAKKVIVGRRGDTKPKTTISHDSSVWAIALRPDDVLGASADSGGTVKLWDVATVRVISSMRLHTQEIYGMAFVLKGTGLVTISRDNTAKYWNLMDKPGAVSVVLQREKIYAIAASPDGRALAIAQGDGTVSCYAVERK